MNLFQAHYKCHQQPRHDKFTTGLPHAWPPANIHKLVVQASASLFLSEFKVSGILCLLIK